MCFPLVSISGATSLKSLARYITYIIYYTFSSLQLPYNKLISDFSILKFEIWD